MAPDRGQVAGTKYLPASRGQPTIINLDQAYPYKVFAALIWGSDRTKFGRPETDLQGHSVCFSGRIQDYRGVPEIVGGDPKQLSKT